MQLISVYSETPNIPNDICIWETRNSPMVKEIKGLRGGVVVGAIQAKDQIDAVP